jgi:hypothetical protein
MVVVVGKSEIWSNEDDQTVFLQYCNWQEKTGFILHFLLTYFMTNKAIV